MKILGIGVDVIQNKRIKNLVNNKKFIKRTFGNNEVKFSKKIIDKTNYYAKRFAAKEAFAKSLGTGISKGLNFTEIEVKKNNLGLPYFKIRGNSLKTVCKIIKKKKFKAYLSLSDDEPFVIATVILCI